MSLFSAILTKLGFEASPAETAPPPEATAAVVEAPPPVKTMTMVDVVAKLQGLAEEHPETLNWQTSIVDLLKLLDLDSSFSARKALATELGCPPDMMHDSARMNLWLHKVVMQKLAENGGNVPESLT